MIKNHVIGVVLPCFKVEEHILAVIAKIGPEVDHIIVVDDHCPNASGEFVKQHCTDPRVTLLRNPQNLGVGGAVMAGYRAAQKLGVDIIIKIDGDGQMDPSLIPIFAAPIITGQADYTKGNRFFYLESLRSMPKIRIFGNAVLSLMSKISTGYWNIFDPTNGYTAIHSSVARLLPLEKISNRYFFETDVLFRLNTLRAVVKDIPMDAVYSDEVSNLKIRKVIPEFSLKHLRNSFKRIFYNYYLRDVSMGSIELPLGLLLVAFGGLFGGIHWIQGNIATLPSSAGTVMLAALPIILGWQLLIAFLNQDIQSVPKQAIHPFLDRHLIPYNSEKSTRSI